MAISTVQGAINGLMPAVSFSKAASGVLLAGSPASLYPVAGGWPAAGSLQTGLNGAIYNAPSSTAGILYRTDPPSGNAYLARLQISTAAVGKIILCDRIWDNTVPNTTTGAQAITTPTWPSRDANGATAGAGLHIGLEISAAASATAAVWTVAYTSDQSVSSTSSPVDIATAAAPGIGRFYRMSWASGDYGVKSISSINFSTAWTSGTFGLVVYRALAILDLPLISTVNLLDAVLAGFPRFYNTTCPFFLMETNTTATNILTGVIQETQG